MKKGFTLVELLVVIAIIAIISLIAVPSIIKISKNSDERLYAQKKENIVAAAELYATNNPDIFQGSDVVNIPVYVLIREGYVSSDLKAGEKECDISTATNAQINDMGCVINPINGNVINTSFVVVTKKAAGVSGVFTDAEGNISSSDSDLLVAKVCSGFTGTNDCNTNGFNCSDSKYYGKFGTGENDYCHCVNNAGTWNIVNGSGTNVNQCVIVSNKESGEVDNWLKYGASEANWRVIGLYRIDGNINAKMITSELID